MSLGTVAVGDDDTAVDENTKRTALNRAAQEVGASSFSSDLVSSGATEVMGYSQSVTLVSGLPYRVHVNCLVTGGTSGNFAGFTVRYSTGTVTNASTQAGGPLRLYHAVGGSTGRLTMDFSVRFTAPTSAAYNIAVGVLTASGSGNTTISGTVTPAVVTVDQIGL